MGFFDELFGTQVEDRGFQAIPQTEIQKRMEKFLEDLAKKVMSFAPRGIAPLTPAERGSVGIAEKAVSEGIPGVSDAMQVLTKRMTGDVEQVPGLEGLFTKTRELGADLLGRTKRGLAMTGNLPSESSRGERIYGRTLQDILEGLVTAAFPFYSQGLAAKYAAPGQLANLGMQDVSMRTGVGTTTGALPRTIQQSIFDAILEAVRMTQTFPYTAQAPIATNILGRQSYAFSPGVSSPSIFSQIASAGQAIAPMVMGMQTGGGGGAGGAGGAGIPKQYQPSPYKYGQYGAAFPS